MHNRVLLKNPIYLHNGKTPTDFLAIFLGCIGATCPCFLFGKNAQFLGSGTLAGSCTTHCMLWGLLTSLCCVFTGGLVLAVPGSAVACYACGYRSALRTKYNLPVCGLNLCSCYIALFFPCILSIRGNFLNIMQLFINYCDLAMRSRQAVLHNFYF